MLFTSQNYFPACSFLPGSVQKGRELNLAVVCEFSSQNFEEGNCSAADLYTEEVPLETSFAALFRVDCFIHEILSFQNGF